MTKQESERRDAELLSALMDGELSERERATMLDRLGGESALRRRWARYHAARAALHDGAVRLPQGFDERVRRARANEPAILAPKRRSRAQPSWLRPLTGIAIAASVAVVAIGGLSLLRGSLSGQTPPVTVADGGDVQATQTFPDAIRPVVVAGGADELVDVPAPVRNRLLLYLASHNGYADTMKVPTGIPYGRLGSINAGQ